MDWASYYLCSIWRLPTAKPSILVMVLVATEARPSATGPTEKSPTASFTLDAQTSLDSSLMVMYVCLLSTLLIGMRCLS